MTFGGTNGPWRTNNIVLYSTGRYTLKTCEWPNKNVVWNETIMEGIINGFTYIL